jgi:multidrug efflux system outer membrane protein
MLSGCEITFDRPELEVSIPPAYRAASGMTGGVRPALDWWRTFRSDEFTRLIEQAQTSNFDIAAAIARIEQADAQSRIAGAPLLPTVNLNASESKSGTGVSSNSAVTTVALNASYELDFWGKNRSASRAAEENAIAARFSRDVVNLSITVSVATAYFLVLNSQDRLRIARENVAAATRVLNLIRDRAKAGTASALDEAQQESLVATQRASIPPLDQTLRQNIATLAVLVGRAPADVRVRGGSLNRLATPRVSPGVPSELLFQRPDLRAAEAQLGAANFSVDFARAAFFPSISLTGQGGYQSTAFALLFTPQSAFYQIAANLTQPILDGFRLEGQLELAKGRQLELLQVYRKTVVQSFADVETALIAIADTAERDRLQREVVMASRRAFEIAETRLREGTVDLVTVLNTQQTLFQAEDNLALARLARMQAVLSLYQALGGSWMPKAPVERQAQVKQ